jgi:hypothetical protein
VTAVEWRSPAIKDVKFIALHESSKLWINISKAQDQEDIWLYENWFYGMTNGVILESGALNGLLFSTSYMFEKFANWTAIHVGMLLVSNMMYTCLSHDVSFQW